ncbi:MAG TPA: sulfotransferase [Kofleriaceae bacterium]|nr:sulfotransferase [Kofleriaceae bacterium]
MEPIYVVSGLPRSGTSMLMRMLEAGGLCPLTDRVREADEDNPRGYYELEAVKRTQADPGWLDGAPGKLVKVISQLLYDLPADRTYRVVFVRRDLDEILASQKTMLERRGEPPGAADDEMKSHLADHVAKLEAWLKNQPHLAVLFASYNRVLADPKPQAERIATFLGAPLDVAAMCACVEPALYRNRK